MSYDLKLRPIHYACVSGGKDSLFMLGLILSNPDKYPLEMVVHYQLEIDWPFAERVVDFMEEMCRNGNIKFIRVKPRKSYDELYEQYGMPNRLFKWCNYKYKLDCVAQINDWISEQNCRPVAYIGLCADEEKRFQYDIGDWQHQDVCYPLAEEGINESYILDWAKEQDIFEDWYKLFDRQGCMFCPNIKRKELAYMYLKERERYDEFFERIRKHENGELDNKASKKCLEHGYKYWNTKNADEMHELIITKWVPKLLKECEEKEIDFL